MHIMRQHVWDLGTKYRGYLRQGNFVEIKERF